MRRFHVNSKMLSIILCIILISVFTLTVAYAVLSVTLNISGNAEIVASNWNIHLDNPKVSSGSVNNNLPVISGNTLTFSSSLTTPGDFYEFTVDVVNDGTIDAMIDSIVVTPELTTDQKKYLRYSVTYQNGESITSKQKLSKGASIPIKVRVEFRKDVVASDLPTSETNLNHMVTLVYSQGDDTSSVVFNDGVAVAFANGSIDDIGTIVTIGTEQFYTIGTADENVKLFAMYNLYVGGSYDSTTTTWTAYGSEATGKQDSTMLGQVSGQSVRKGTTAFSSDSQKGTNYSSYSGSIVEGYVNNYKSIIEDYGIVVEEARLITKDELVNDQFGCFTSSPFCMNSPYAWVHSTSYWTGSSRASNSVWRMRYDGYFQDHYYYAEDSYGVRPVIIIPRNAIMITKDMIEFSVSGVTYQAEEGMTWGEWVDSSYNTDGFYADAYIFSNSDENIAMSGDCPTPEDVIDPSVTYVILSYQCG